MSTEHKAVLLSIRPEWCVKILNGEKTVGDSQESAKTEASVQVLHLLHEGSKKANHHL